MPELRKAEQEVIKGILDRTPLTSLEFVIKTNLTENNLVVINYIEESKFKFIIRAPNDGFTNWTTEECPGVSFTETEEYTTLRDYPSCRSRISGWANRIIEDLSHMSEEVKESIVYKLKENLDKNAESLIDPEIPFTKEEAIEWEAKFDDMISWLKTLEEQKKIQAGKIAQLEAEMKLLKEKATILPKKTWVKSAGNKCLNALMWVSETAIKAVADSFAARLIPGANPSVE